ncbi:MAG: hypothetical protein PVG65_00860 [Candidatus Thorarchaeota archaeon]|jgi:hypothetical protein
MFSKIKIILVLLSLAFLLLFPLVSGAKKLELTNKDLKKISKTVGEKHRKSFENFILEIFNHVRDYPLRKYYTVWGQNKAIDNFFTIFEKYTYLLPLVNSGAKIFHKKGSNEVVYYIIIQFRRDFTFQLLELPFNVLKLKGIEKKIFDKKLYNLPPDDILTHVI